MNIDLVIVGLTVATNLGLGIVVFSRNPRKLVNQIFAGMVFAVVLWSFSNFLADTSKTLSIALFSTKLTFVAAIWIGYFLAEFGIYFPNRLPKIPKWVNLVIIFPPIILSSLSLTDSIVRGIEFKEYGVNVLLGPFYSLFMISFLLYFFTGLVLLTIQRRYARDLEKSQLNFIFTGLFLAGTLASLTNLIIPFITKSAAVSKFGPLFAVIFITFAAYAIVKHHLFNIRVILTEVLAALIVLGILLEALLSKSPAELYGRLILVVLVAYGGVWLIRSVKEEIKRREEVAHLASELKQANIKLQELDKAKSEFISIASHELNSPIAIVRGYLSMILKEKMAKVDEKAREFLEKSDRSAEQLANLVKDLLNVSRIEEKRIEVEIKPTDLVEAIKTAIFNFQNQAKERNLYLRFEEPEKPIPAVQADPDKLQEILSNLISNGLKYTKEGGVTISLKQGDSELITAIKDTGIGIPKEAQKHLFEKFFRVESAMTMEESGTGLGLYVTKGLLNLMNGRIWFESQEGKGSTFYFCLPIVAKEKEGETAAPLPEIAPKIPLISIDLSPRLEEKLKEIGDRAIKDLSLQALIVFLVFGNELRGATLSSIFVGSKIAKMLEILTASTKTAYHLREHIKDFVAPLSVTESPLVKTILNAKPLFSQKEFPVWEPMVVFVGEQKARLIQRVYRVHSVALFPLLVKEKIGGVVLLASKKKDLGPQREEISKLVEEIQSAISSFSLSITEKGRGEERGEIKEEIKEKITGEEIPFSKKLEERLKEIGDRALKPLDLQVIDVHLIKGEMLDHFVLSSIYEGSPMAKLVDYLFGGKISTLGYPLKEKENLFVRTVLEGKPIILKEGQASAYDLLRPLVSKKRANLIQKFYHVHSVALFPLIVKNKVVGGVFIASKRKDLEMEEEQLTELIKEMEKEIEKSHFPL